LLLRHWEEADLPAFLDIYSRDEVTRWLGTHPRRALATTDEARERLDRWIAGGRRLDPPLGLWAMVPLSPAGQQPVGTLLLMPLTDADGPAGLVEIGWHLHPRGQGQGFATEAAEAVLAAAAGAGIDQVLALTDLDNIRSQAVTARLGMSDEGTTDRWYGLTVRQFRKAITVADR
jgi:RimJ/RimL family protein N-acetyltransferase